MKSVKILSLAAFAVGSLGLSSCGCCSGERPAPSLRSLPNFKEISVTPEDPASPEDPATPESPITQEK